MVRDEGFIMTTATLMGLPLVAMLAAGPKHNHEDDYHE